MFAKVSKQMDFYGNLSPIELIEKYGSPLYVYNEDILRKRCREIKNLVKYPNFKVHYSAKANSNLSLLKIIKNEGLMVDAMSAGEMFVEEKAGFSPEEIVFICNNVSQEEMKFAINKEIKVSVDSLSQLKMYGKLNSGGELVVRFNPGIGAGHSESVITGGEKTKFGIEIKDIEEVLSIARRYNLKIVGLNQHLGSQFMDWFEYANALEIILKIANNFLDLKFVDLGGGFGIPYHKQDDEKRLELSELGEELDIIFEKFEKENKRGLEFRVEPGRYIVAECGILLGTVYAKKQNDYRKYIGTDLGFNVFMRHVMYGSHHDVEIYRKGEFNFLNKEKVVIVGNICESGDIIVQERLLPIIEEGDILGVLDTGAYGFCMSSNYNNRLRPAEVLIKSNKKDILIRKRETFEDLIKNFC